MGKHLKKSPRNYSTEAHKCKFLSNQKKTRTVFNVHKSKLSKLKPFVKQGEAKKRNRVTTGKQVTIFIGYRIKQQQKT